MSLEKYFAELIEKVETTDLVSNQDMDKGGFYRPTRTIVLNQLRLLKDLHAKPAAKPMLREAWRIVVEHLPPEALVLNDEQKAELKKILS